jgi:transposase
VKTAAPRVVYGRETLLAWKTRVQSSLPEDAVLDASILSHVVDTYLFLVEALSRARVRLGRLKRWLFGSKSERKDDLFPGERGGREPGQRGRSGESGRRQSKNDAAGSEPKKGHGRRGTKDYPGAQRIRVEHPTFKSGCPCPDENCDGKLYRIKNAREIPRFFGQALLIVKVWLQELWRCHLCDKIIGAPLPPEADGDKYDVSAVVMLAMAHFAYGLPAYRLEQHQESAGVPIAASVQKSLLRGAYEKLAVLFDELVRQAAQLDVFHNDDTRTKVLELLKKIKSEQSDPGTATDAKKKLRTGIHTTGIVAVSLAHGYQIALYFTGRQHAGENLTDVLAKRRPGRPPPIHTSDGLDHNKPKDMPVIPSKCVVHARRQFVDIRSSFPEQCRYVIEKIAVVYHVDDMAKKRKLSDEDRLLLHQEKSGPVMESLRRWLVEQLLEGDEEPNSELGAAIQYMLKLWDPLMKFLHVPGVPLDNNPVERILKVIIRHRKNSLFFKTEKGARVGDFFMSLFETCDLNRVDKIHYLTTVLSNVDSVVQSPGSWMPWNYRTTVCSQAAPSPEPPVDGKIVPGSPGLPQDTTPTAPVDDRKSDSAPTAGRGNDSRSTRPVTGPVGSEIAPGPGQLKDRQATTVPSGPNRDGLPHCERREEARCPT